MRVHPGCGRSGAELVSVGGALDTTTWLCSCGKSFQLERCLPDQLIEEVGKLLGAIGRLAKRTQMARSQGHPTSAGARCDSYVSRLFEIFETGRALNGPLVPDEPTPDTESEPG